MKASDRIVIVGAGQGGYQAAASLRDSGFEGGIVLVGEESGLPYQRPPLSKDYLTGKASAAMLDLRPANFFDERRIERVSGLRAEAIDRANQRLALSDGRSLAYDHLVLATGSRNVQLNVPGAELDGVVQLRTLEDAEIIRRSLPDLKKVVIVGAGFIGLEFAAVTVERGIDTVVLEASERPMSRALSRDMSAHFHKGHSRAGARFEYGTSAAEIIGENGRVSAVVSADGRRFPADLVLVGIGVRPNVELASEAGLATSNGIVVDAHLATADAAISAIGDCAAYPSRFAGGRVIRIESVQNAVDHARALAARLAGGTPAPYGAVPWFWSDQGDMRLQIAGLATPHEETVLRGDPASGSFSVFCYAGDDLLGVESVNRPADHMASRKILAGGRNISRNEAADLSFDLKALAAAARARG